MDFLTPARFTVMVFDTAAVATGLIGVVIGAVLSAGFAFALYEKQRKDSKSDEQIHAERSGLLAEQNVVEEHYKCAYSAKTWLSNLPTWVNAPDTPARQDVIREEAMKRINDCHLAWDLGHMRVDSAEVRSAMDGLDVELMVALNSVVGGNLSPALSALTESLKALRDVANRRLDTRWH